MSMMKSQILDSSMTQKSKYLLHETLFLQTKTIHSLHITGLVKKRK